MKNESWLDISMVGIEIETKRHFCPSRPIYSTVNYKMDIIHKRTPLIHRMEMSSKKTSECPRWNDCPNVQMPQSWMNP